MNVIGLDVGTTACKAIVFSENGAAEGSAFREYGIIYGENGKAEQDADAIWGITKNVLKEAIKKAGCNDISAICVSVQGDAVIPVDREINPLHNALLGMDYRSDICAAHCAELFGDRYLFETTGMRPHPMNSLTKILWLKENAADVFDRTYKFMTYADYITAKLGAEPTIDYTMASRTMGLDLDEKSWSKKILSKLDIDESRLSAVAGSGQIIGQIDTAVAADIGITSKTLLISGGHDQVCAAIGAGAVRPGIALNSHGTAEVLSSALDAPLLNETMYNSFYPCYLYAIDSKYFTFSLNHVGGVLFNWYRDTFAHPEIEKAAASQISAYQIITSQLSEEPSKLLVLPHFIGSGTPWCDLASKGAIVGLSLSTTRHDIAKAILESSAYELRINIENMNAAGIVFDELRCVGGAAKSDLWMQVKADITEKKVVLLQTKEAACFGAAILALSALNIFNSIEDAVDNLVKPGKTFYPNETRTHRYFEKYMTYKKLYPALKEINREL